MTWSLCLLLDDYPWEEEASLSELDLSLIDTWLASWQSFSELSNSGSDIVFNLGLVVDFIDRV